MTRAMMRQSPLFGKRTVQKQGRTVLTALHKLYWRMQSGYPV
jgi:hypothetical protein